MVGALLSLVLSASWSEPVRVAFEEGCALAYAEEERPRVFCACVARTVQGSVTEEEIVEFATIPVSPVDARVGAALRAAEAACRAEREVLDV